MTQRTKGLMSSLRANSELRTMRFRHDILTIQCIIPVRSKSEIDAIDMLVADGYGLAKTELDFILNYDIKYRMGSSAE
jgi:hypothetical protein